MLVIPAKASDTRISDVFPHLAAWPHRDKPDT